MTRVSRLLGDTPANSDPIQVLVKLNHKYKILSTAAYEEGSDLEDWRLIFKAMFMNGDVEILRDTAKILGRTIEWYTPDTSYEDDVMAVIRAMNELVESILGDPSSNVVQHDDWFKRHADYNNPKAFINTDPSYYALECAAAVEAGRLIPVKV